MKHKTLLLSFLSIAAFAVGCGKEQTTSQQIEKVKTETKQAAPRAIGDGLSCFSTARIGGKVTPATLNRKNFFSKKEKNLRGEGGRPVFSHLSRKMILNHSNFL